MSCMCGFTPWIAFGGLSLNAFDWRFTALADLVTAVLTTVYALLRGQSTDALIPDIGTALFLIIIAVNGFVDARSPLEQWAGALSLVWLAVIAWGSTISQS